MIKKEFPNIDGLQDPVLGDGNHYIPNVNEGIQIHHVGNHWVTSSIVLVVLYLYMTASSTEIFRILCSVSLLQYTS